MPAELGEQQIERYSRQIIMREIGGTGQSLLLRSRCLVAGSGPAFEVAAQYLATTGVGTLDLLADPSARRGSGSIGASFALLEGANPDVAIRVSSWIPERGHGVAGEAPVVLADYDVVLEVFTEGGRFERSRIADRISAGTPRAAWITLTTRPRGDVVLLVIARAANACPTCVDVTEPEEHAAAGRSPSEHARSALERRPSTATIDLALAGTMGALAACRAIARIATDGCVRALRLDREAPVWQDVATRRAASCPRDCRNP